MNLKSLFYKTREPKYWVEIESLDADNRKDVCRFPTENDDESLSILEQFYNALSASILTGGWVPLKDKDGRIVSVYRAERVVSADALYRE